MSKSKIDDKEKKNLLNGRSVGTKTNGMDSIAGSLAGCGRNMIRLAKRSGAARFPISST